MSFSIHGNHEKLLSISEKAMSLPVGITGKSISKMAEQKHQPEAFILSAFIQGHTPKALTPQNYTSLTFFVTGLVSTFLTVSLFSARLNVTQKHKLFPQMCSATGTVRKYQASAASNTQD